LLFTFQRSFLWFNCHSLPAFSKFRLEYQGNSKTAGNFSNQMKCLGQLKENYLNKLAMRQIPLENNFLCISFNKTKQIFYLFKVF
jgi:hypothetical protein